MKVRYIILLMLITAVIAGLAGHLLPIGIFHPNIVNKEISLNDYYTRLISIVGAFATIFATAIALFKEDIKKLYEYASLEVGFKNGQIIHEILDETSGTTSTVDYVAKKYEIVLTISNSGRLASRGCQVYLESLSFHNSQYPTPQEYTTTGKPMPWIGKPETTTIIPSLAKSYVSIIEILSPQSDIVTSKEANPKLKPKLKVADLDLPSQGSGKHAGTYKCVFMVYSENAKPVEILVELQWNGMWQNRLAEMNKCVTVTHKSCKK